MSKKVTNTEEEIRCKAKFEELPESERQKYHFHEECPAKKKLFFYRWVIGIMTAVMISILVVACNNQGADNSAPKQEEIVKEVFKEVPQEFQDGEYVIVGADAESAAEALKAGLEVRKLSDFEEDKKEKTEKVEEKEVTEEAKTDSDKDSDSAPETTPTATRQSVVRVAETAPIASVPNATTAPTVTRLANTTPITGVPATVTTTTEEVPATTEEPKAEETPEVKPEPTPEVKPEPTPEVKPETPQKEEEHWIKDKPTTHR